MYRFNVHYFTNKPYFLEIISAPHTSRMYKIHPKVKEVYIGTTCYTPKIRTEIQTLTFLERTKMVRMYNKIAMLNNVKTCLSLKMSNVCISNDKIKISIPHYYSICGLMILLCFVLSY